MGPPSVPCPHPCLGQASGRGCLGDQLGSPVEEVVPTSGAQAAARVAQSCLAVGADFEEFGTGEEMRPGARGRGSQGHTLLARDPLLWEAGELALEPRQDQPWGLPGEGGPFFPWPTRMVLRQAAPGWPLCPGVPGWPRRLCAPP